MQLADPHGQELFDLYCFLTAVAEELLARLTDATNKIEFAELLGSITGLGCEAAKVLLYTQVIRQEHPAIYDAWAGSVRAARQMGGVSRNEQAD